MGRPINKRFFGATGVDAQPTIPIRFFSTSLIEGKILSQRGTNKFNCSNDGDTVTEICRLVEATPAVDGECQLIGLTDGGNPVAIRKMFNRTAIDFNSNRYTWTVEDDSTESLLRLVAI